MTQLETGKGRRTNYKPRFPFNQRTGMFWRLLWTFLQRRIRNALKHLHIGKGLNNHDYFILKKSNTYHPRVARSLQCSCTDLKYWAATVST